MRVTISSLVLFICCATSAQLPVIQLFQNPSSAANNTNFPATLSGNEHFWLASDLTNGVLNVWTDRGPAALSWYKESGPIKAPTNTSAGLGFYGNQAITNLDKNSSGIHSSMSTDDGVNLRLFCVAYTTTNTHNMGFLSDPLVGAEGANMNATGGSGDQTGNVNYQTTAADHVLCTGLKTDGTLQDYCFGNTNVGATFGAEGYTNGVLCLQVAPNGSMTTLPLLCIGEGFNLTKAFVQAVAVYTNVNRAVTASNFHWWRTNIFGGSP